MYSLLVNKNFLCSLLFSIIKMSVMAGSLGRMYGTASTAATLVGKDEMNGRINPALEPDDDLPVSNLQTNQTTGGGGQAATAPGAVQSHTAF